MKFVAVLTMVVSCLFTFQIQCTGEVCPDALDDFFDFEEDSVNRAILRGGIIHEEEFDKNSELDQSNSFITISLGCNCHPATFTRLHGIRFFSAPFDWVVTPFSTLYNFIKNDFKDFLKKENLVAPSPNLSFPEHVQTLIADLKHISRNEYADWLFDKESGMFSIHDFPKHTLESVNEFHAAEHAKYQRRIKRLYQEMKTGKHVYFIRYLNITKTESCELYALLKSKFPETPFTLVVVGNNPAEFGVDWGIPHIKNFCIYTEFVAGMSLEGNLFWRSLCHDIKSGALLEC